MPRDLLEYLAKALVDHPEKVKVDAFDEDSGALDERGGEVDQQLAH